MRFACGTTSVNISNSLRRELSEKHCQAGDVSPWPRQTHHVANADGIGMGREHDRYRARRLPRRLDHGRGYGKDDIHFAANEISRKVGKLICPFRPPKFNRNILTFDVPKVPQSRPQRLDPIHSHGSRSEIQITNFRDFFGLLCLRGERPCSGRASYQPNEFTAPHCRCPETPHDHSTGLNQHKERCG